MACISLPGIPHNKSSVSLWCFLLCTSHCWHNSTIFVLTGDCSHVPGKQCGLFVWSEMVLSNQVSTSTVKQLSAFLDAILSLNSSILLANDQQLARRRLGTVGRCGLALSLTWMPLRLPKNPLPALSLAPPRQNEVSVLQSLMTLDLQQNGVSTFKSGSHTDSTKPLHPCSLPSYGELLYSKFWMKE